LNAGHLNIVRTPESTVSSWSELLGCTLSFFFRDWRVVSWGLSLMLSTPERISLSFYGFLVSWTCWARQPASIAPSPSPELLSASGPRGVDPNYGMQCWGFYQRPCSPPV